MVASSTTFPLVAHWRGLHVNPSKRKVSRFTPDDCRVVRPDGRSRTRTASDFDTAGQSDRSSIGKYTYFADGDVSLRRSLLASRTRKAWRSHRTSQ